MNKLRNSQPIQLNDISINDSFWSNYIKLVHDVIIPYEWEALNDRIPDAEPSYSVRNFRIAAGEEEGEYKGPIFQDHGLVTWLEAVGHTLQTTVDPELEKLADRAIELIEKAQQKDGYLNSYFIIKEPEKRWTNLLECHELFCAGHMIEAAVAYYCATGKKKFLDVVCRYADYINSIFGPEPEKLKGYCGHEEIELALVKLYKVTKNEKYLNLAKYFIDERGKEPNYFDIEWEKRGKTYYWPTSEYQRTNKEYTQSHLPVREQIKAVGHAVRAVYLYAAMADIAAETGDNKLFEACSKLWESITLKQMYITGGIGSTAVGEAFTFDFDLPNDTIYQETCASIGLVFFAHRMLQIEARGSYADVMERVLYNSILSGVAQDGKHFFYVNPLEIWPEACVKNPGKKHVKPVRQKWYGCACCPPNIARLLSSLGQYIYTINETTVYIHLYIGSETDIEIGGEAIRLVQETNYPWDGRVALTLARVHSKEFTIALRIPGWCRNATVSVNGEKIEIEARKGYMYIYRNWKEGDSVTIKMEMPVELMTANPKVRANAGKVAIQRGPLVYCLEEEDNGDNLSALSLQTEVSMTSQYEDGLCGGGVIINGEALRTSEDEWNDHLYHTFVRNESKVMFKAVPYYLWGNRKPGEMIVWARAK